MTYTTLMEKGIRESAWQKYRTHMYELDSANNLASRGLIPSWRDWHAGFDAGWAARWNTPEISASDWDAWSETVDADSSLYMVHHAGPDDIYSARSWREAVEIAFDINSAVLDYVRRTENDGWVMSWATPYRRDIAVEGGVISE